MRLKDLPSIPENIHRRLEQRSEEQGRALADSIVNSTRQGRGFWIFLLIPGWVMLFSSVAATAQTLLGLNFFISLLAGLAVAVFWWKHEFTYQHPFKSWVLASFGLPILLGVTGNWS
ncbi:MAG: hypothetical protein RIR18_1081 [Pseudomonadota bacterium]|jgi:hypothetical protein